MLKNIIIKNFKSIEFLDLNLEFKEKRAPKGHKDLETLSFIEPTTDNKDRLVSIMNIYGANASGKSNIINALFSLKTLLFRGLDTLSSQVFSINKLKDLGEYSEIEINFFLEKKLYKYIISYNQQDIHFEKLFIEEEIIFSITKESINFTNIETETSSSDFLQKKFKEACFVLFDSNNTVRQIKPFLSYIIKEIPSLNQDLSKVQHYLKNNLSIHLNNEINHQFAIDELAKSTSQVDIDDAFLKISEFIGRLDIDINNFQYKEFKKDFKDCKGENNELRIPKETGGVFSINAAEKIIKWSEIKTEHTHSNGSKVLFNFEEESTGTKLSFGLIGTILKTLESGGVLFIDELDRSLHTLLLQSLIRVFKDKDYNDKNAQLICTMHNTDILEDSIYKISEFSFINKNLKSGTTIRRLSDISGIRNEANFRDRYLEGMYSGIPNPYY